MKKTFSFSLLFQRSTAQMFWTTSLAVNLEFHGQAHDHLFLFQMRLVSSPRPDKEAVSFASLVHIQWLRIALRGTWYCLLAEVQLQHWVHLHAAWELSAHLTPCPCPVTFSEASKPWRPLSVFLTSCTTSDSCWFSLFLFTVSIDKFLQKIW